MKIKTVINYFLIVYVLQKGYSVTKSNTETSLLLLNNLQREHCFSQALCRINGTNETTINKQFANCCKTCSCEKECTAIGNCCPDLDVSHFLIDGRIIPKADSIFNTSENLDASFHHHLHDTGSLSSKESTDTKYDKFSCIRSQVANKDFKMEKIMYPEAYRMVTSCPKNFIGEDDIKIKCNINNQVKPSLMVYAGPDLVVAVTSLKTNYTYINEYCLLCNEGNDVLNDVIQWDAFFVSFNKHHLMDDTSDPYSMLNHIASGRSFYGSNIIYQPSDKVTHIVPKCRKIDVTSCPDDTDIDILTVCKMYHLPVVSKARYNKGYKVYNNIACYLCNNKMVFKADCELDYAQSIGYSMQLNFLKNNGHLSTIRRYNSSEHQLLNISFTEIGSKEKCKKGYVRIYGTESCRIVLCPLNFYLVDGSCIPTYHLITNVYFSIVLEVIRARRLQNNEEENSFYRNYRNAVKNAVGLSVNFTFSLWKLTNSTDALLVTLTKPDSTYIDLLKEMSTFLIKVTFLEIKTMSSTIQVMTSLFKDNSRPRLLSGKLYRPYVHGMDNGLLPIIYMDRAFSKQITYINIDKAHLCYRVKLATSDVYKDENGVILLNKTGMALPLASLRNFQDLNNVSTCTDEVNEHIENSYMFGGYNVFTRQRIAEFGKHIATAGVVIKGDSNIEKTPAITLANELIIFIVFAIVVSFTCLLQLIYVKRKERNANES